MARTKFCSLLNIFHNYHNAEKNDNKPEFISKDIYEDFYENDFQWWKKKPTKTILSIKNFHISLVYWQNTTEKPNGVTLSETIQM